MSFTEASTVENLIRDLLCGGVTHHTAVGAGIARRNGKVLGLGWHYVAPANIPRHVFAEHRNCKPHLLGVPVAFDSRMNAMEASYA